MGLIICATDRHHDEASRRCRRNSYAATPTVEYAFPAFLVIWGQMAASRCGSAARSPRSSARANLPGDYQRNRKMKAVDWFGSGRFGSSTLNLSGTVVQPS